MANEQNSTISEKGMLVEAIGYSVACHGYCVDALRFALGYYQAERRALDPVNVSQFNAQQAVRISRGARRILHGQR